MSLSNDPMEYLSQLPEPVQNITKERDRNTTLWITKAGEFLVMPTREQAKEKAEYTMEHLNPKEWWAQKISKFAVGQEDYICAYIIRDFSKNHNRSDFSQVSFDEMWLGRIEIGLPFMTTDTRQRSDTVGERVSQFVQTKMPDGSVQRVPVLGSKGFYSYHKATKDNAKIYQAMEGLTMKGKDTQYIQVLLDGGRNVGVDDAATFWSTTLKQALTHDRAQKKVEESKEAGKTRPTNIV